MENSLSNGFRLGEWLVKPLANKLICDSGEGRVEPKVMDVLVQLALAKGQVVTRTELLKSVWNRVVVNEEALTRAISELRHALGDYTGERRYIRTIPKRGYSLIPVVEIMNVCVKPQSDVEPSPSVAVLPFQNLGDDGDHDYFTDGLTEELISALVQIDGLHVAASRSIFSFKDRSVSIKEIGKQLGVNHILEGSVRRSGSHLRVTTQLVQVSDGFQLWSARFDKQLDDVFRIQEEISQAVVDGLELKLGFKPTSLVPEKTANLEAYELFLKGRLKYQNEQHGMAYTGLTELQQAIELSPQFPEAQGLFAYVKTLNSISEPTTKTEPPLRIPSKKPCQ